MSCRCWRRSRIRRQQLPLCWHCHRFRRRLIRWPPPLRGRQRLRPERRPVLLRGRLLLPSPLLQRELRPERRPGRRLVRRLVRRPESTPWQR